MIYTGDSILKTEESILIEKGIIITVNKSFEVLKSGFIYIEGSRIIDVGKMSKINSQYKHADKIIDAKGKVILPGLISGHTHAALSLIRGISSNGMLDDWVKNVLRPYESYLLKHSECSYMASLFACLNMIKNGVTCFADMHFNMDKVARAVQESGIRASLSVAMMDQEDTPLTYKESIKQNESLVKEWHNKANGRITTMFGPCTIRTCSTELFQKARELADKYNVGLHIHLSEVKLDVDYSLKNFGKRPVEHLYDIGFLRDDVLAAHCIWLNEKELQILSKTRVNVIHNPSSNLRLASGIAPIKKMLKYGINVGLGIDTALTNNTMDMFREMRLTSLFHKMVNNDPSFLTVKALIKMATLNNAKALGLEKDVGSLEPGKKADIIIINFKHPDTWPAITVKNVLNNLVYSCSGWNVETVIVDGKIIMENREVKSIDEENVYKETSQKIGEVLEEIEEFKKYREEKLY